MRQCLDLGTDAVFLDLEGQPATAEEALTVLAQNIPFCPVIISHSMPVSNADTGLVEGLLFHVNSLALEEELEHILISLSIDKITAEDFTELQDMHEDHIPRVLIVDDDEDTAARLARALRTSDNYDIQMAHSGSQAGTILPAFAPDVTIVDLASKDIDGHTVCSFIRGDERLRATKVIGIHGHEKTEGRRQAQFDEYMARPFFVQEIVDRVRSFVSGT